MNIINNINDTYVPAWGNKKKYIAVHYLGVDGQNNKIERGGYGAHFYIYWDGRTYQACSYDAVVWQVGTGGYYTQLHPYANNYNTIGIEMCVHCDGNANNPKDPRWWFTEETQIACVELVQYLMKKFNIPIENVLRHGDIVNKWCGAPYMNNNKYKTSWTWDEFKARVANNNVKSDKWILQDNRWWYKHADGSYVKENWELIDGKWYYFDADGWMVTGWLKLEDTWYYLNSDGSMATGWKVIGLNWYYFNASGHMLDGWQKINGIWYLFDENGAITTGWKKIEDKWFYLDGNGAMAIGWKWAINGWYYFNQNGIMQTGWFNDGNKWYYLEEDGKMANGWKVINDKTYYFNDKGEMVTNTYVQSADPNIKDKYYWMNSKGEWDSSADSWDVTKYNTIKLQ